MASKKEILRQHQQAETLQSLGFTQQEAEQLRRISMTLQRWFEHECNGEIQRDESTNKPYWVSEWGTRWTTGKRCRRPIPDRETGARKRLAAIIKARNARKYVMGTDYYGLRRDEVSAYIQTDPRGAALYIIRPGDVPEGANVSAYHNRGICVY